ncbi:MAG: GRRM system radical SAM/SPASM domain protein [Symploca sp. SIO2B6]|nr:GRRM system radical SAM/SPASM domain protein [Symploca sp. SIO2B6]
MVFAPIAPTTQTNLKKEALPLDTFGPIRLVVIQGTSLCNLNCEYCYLPDRHLKNQISLDLIEPIFERIFTSQFLDKRFTVCWHAGEPLTVPISFYRAASEKIEALKHKYDRQDINVTYAVQTNGTLINQKWCDFFKEHSFKVGVSVDGPEFIHDAYRKTWQGDGTHKQVMRGIKFLQDNGIDCHTISVLTSHSLNYPDEIFKFFVDNKIRRIGFNVEEVEGAHDTSSLTEASAEKRYRSFMTRLWELNKEAKGILSIREFDRICRFIYTGKTLDKSDLVTPFSILNIDNKGNFSTFSPELLSMKDQTYGDMIFGNVLTDSFESVCDTEKFRSIYNEIHSGYQMCQNTCQYFSVCGGGAPSNKYWENGSFNSSETIFCRLTKKAVTDIVLDDLETSLGLK